MKKLFILILAIIFNGNSISASQEPCKKAKISAMVTVAAEIGAQKFLAKAPACYCLRGRGFMVCDSGPYRYGRSLRSVAILAGLYTAHAAYNCFKSNKKFE